MKHLRAILMVLVLLGMGGIKAEAQSSVKVLSLKWQEGNERSMH